MKHRKKASVRNRVQEAPRLWTATDSHNSDDQSAYETNAAKDTRDSEPFELMESTNDDFGSDEDLAALSAASREYLQSGDDVAPRDRSRERDRDSLVLGLPPSLWVVGFIVLGAGGLFYMYHNRLHDNTAVEVASFAEPTPSTAQTSAASNDGSVSAEASTAENDAATTRPATTDASTADTAATDIAATDTAATDTAATDTAATDTAATDTAATDTAATDIAATDTAATDTAATDTAATDTAATDSAATDTAATDTAATDTAATDTATPTDVTAEGARAEIPADGNAASPAPVASGQDVESAALPSTQTTNENVEQSAAGSIDASGRSQNEVIARVELSEEQLAEAATALANDEPRALALYRELIVADPEHPEVVAGYAVLQEKALNDFLAFVKSNPSADPGAYGQLLSDDERALIENHLEAAKSANGDVGAMITDGLQDVRKNQVAWWVALGDRRFEAGDVVLADGNGAVDAYRYASQLDANSAAAAAGLERVRAQHIAAIQPLLDEQNWAAARAEVTAAADIRIDTDIDQLIDRITDHESKQYLAELIDKADAYIESGKLVGEESALSVLNAAIILDPENETIKRRRAQLAPRLVDIARTQADEKNFDSAMDYLHLVLALNPENKDALNQLAQVEEDATAWASIEALIAKSRSQIESDDFIGDGGAIATLKEVLEIDPQNAEAIAALNASSERLATLAMEDTVLERFDDAKIKLEAALSIRPGGDQLVAALNQYTQAATPTENAAADHNSSTEGSSNEPETIAIRSTKTSTESGDDASTTAVSSLVSQPIEQIGVRASTRETTTGAIDAASTEVSDAKDAPSTDSADADSESIGAAPSDDEPGGSSLVEVADDAEDTTQLAALSDTGTKASPSIADSDDNSVRESVSVSDSDSVSQAPVTDNEQVASRPTVADNAPEADVPVADSDRFADDEMVASMKSVLLPKPKTAPKPVSMEPTSASVCAGDYDCIGMVIDSGDPVLVQMGNEMSSLVAGSTNGTIVKPTQGPIANTMRMLSRENAGLSVVPSDMLSYAERSDDEGLRLASKRLRFIMSIGQKTVFLVARKDIASIEDLDDKRVVMGPSNTAIWVVSNNLLHLYDVTPSERIQKKPPPGLLDLLRGDADAVFVVGPNPHPLLKNLSQMRSTEKFARYVEDLHILPIIVPESTTEYVADIANYPGLSEDVATVAILPTLVSYDFTHKSTPYFQRRCDELARIGDTVVGRLKELRESGHKQWASTSWKLSAGPWQQDACFFRNQQHLAKK